MPPILEKPLPIVLEKNPEKVTIDYLYALTGQIEAALGWLKQADPSFFTHAGDLRGFDEYSIKIGDTKVFSIQIIELLYRLVKVEYQEIIEGEEGKSEVKKTNFAINSMDVATLSNRVAGPKSPVGLSVMKREKRDPLYVNPVSEQLDLTSDHEIVLLLGGLISLINERLAAV